MMSVDKGKGRREPRSDENASWKPGQKGQGGEGLSKGYGGSAGRGTGASGPETGSDMRDDAERSRANQRSGDSRGGEQQKGQAEPSPSLPSKERISRVLR